VATPIDPRHRLVTTKYNPARTWTPENAVGIGGAYMCIYGMEGPGGYQLFGRTIQVWNTWRQTPVFAKGKPWLLNFFDQIKFFPVDHKELTEARSAFPHGGYPITIEDTEFSYAAYEKELQVNASSIGSFKTGQQAAFNAERQRWKQAGLDTFVNDEGAGESMDGDIAAGCFGVASAVPGNIWKMLVEPGMAVAAGDTLAIIESMKMEINVTSHAAGRVKELRAGPGRNVKAGDILVVLEEI
jgi:urea carboxylase